MRSMIRGRVLHTVVAVPFASLIVACGSNPEASGLPGEPSWTLENAWHLSSEPVLDFATFAGSPEYEFTRIRGAFRLGDGRIIAANFTNPPEIRTFLPDGTLDWVVGGDGEGPGEFTGISWLVHGGGDTLVVHDTWQSRSTLLDATGEVLGIVRVIQESSGERPVRRAILGRFSDGTYLGFPNTFFPIGDQDFGRASVLVLRTRLDGSVVDTVGFFPWTDFEPGEGGRRTKPIFGKEAVAFPYGDRLLHGVGDDFSIQVYALDGTLLGNLERPHTSRPVTSDMISVLKERELAQVQGQEAEAWSAQIARRYRDAPRADALPAYERFVVDALDHVWVQAFLAPGDSVISWSVFSPAGSFLGELGVPSAFRITDVGADYVLGVWADQLDVETLRVFELIKPE